VLLFPKTKSCRCYIVLLDSNNAVCEMPPVIQPVKQQKKTAFPPITETPGKHFSVAVQEYKD